MTDLPAIHIPRLDWKSRGKYPKLQGISLEEWLLANHRERAPSELQPEIEALIGHSITLRGLRGKCHKLGLKASAESYRKAVQKGLLRVSSRQAVPKFDPDAVWKATQELAEQLRYKVARMSEITVDFSDEERPIGIAHLCDLHIGGIGVDYEAIERDVELIAGTDGLYCRIGGDEIDNFIQSFMAQAMPEQVITASVQWKLLERILGKLAHKVLYAAVGNHEMWTVKASEVDKFGELVADFKLLNMKHIGVATILVGGQKYISEEAHRFWGRSRLNPLHTCTRLLDYGIAADPDILLVEHEHVPAAEFVERRGKTRYLIRPGTYKTSDEYAAEHHFYGAKVAPPVIIFWPDEYRLHLLHSVVEAASYLNFLRGGQ